MLFFTNIDKRLSEADATIDAIEPKNVKRKKEEEEKQLRAEHVENDGQIDLKRKNSVIIPISVIDVVSASGPFPLGA